eukprot:COSAG02_NODE_47_length_45434_cov_101.776221_12_plen_77_part_00
MLGVTECSGWGVVPRDVVCQDHSWRGKLPPLALRANGVYEPPSGGVAEAAHDGAVRNGSSDRTIVCGLAVGAARAC